MSDNPRMDKILEVLRGLKEEAEQGDIVGVYVVTETNKNGIGTAYVLHDVHRAIGGLTRLQARLLEVDESDDTEEPVGSAGVN